jgi:integrase
MHRANLQGCARTLPRLGGRAIVLFTSTMERGPDAPHADRRRISHPTKPAPKWDTAWRALRDAAGLPGLRFHDLRHTVVTRLLEAGEPDHVVESITGHLSRSMLEHDSHIRLEAKRDALDRLDGSGTSTSAKV